MLFIPCSYCNSLVVYVRIVHKLVSWILKKLNIEAGTINHGTGLFFIRETLELFLIKEVWKASMT